MEPATKDQVASSPPQDSNLLRLLPSEILNVIIDFLPDAKDVVLFGSTSKATRKAVLTAETWQERLKQEYVAPYNRLKSLSTPSNSSLWYLEYAKVRMSHWFLSRAPDSYKPTKIFAKEWVMPVRRGSRLGRSLNPTFVDCGRKIILRCDRNLCLMDASTGKILRTGTFPKEIGNVRPINTSQTLVAAFGVLGSLYILNIRTWRFSTPKFPPANNLTLWVDTDQSGPLMCAYLTCDGIFAVRRKPMKEQHFALQPFQPRNGLFVACILPGTEIIITAISGSVSAYQSTPTELRRIHNFNLSSIPMLLHTITHSVYTIGNQGEALIVFLLTGRKMRFLWFCPELGFTLLPPPLREYGTLIHNDNPALYRFSTMTGGAWRPNAQNVAMTLIYQKPNGPSSPKSLCAPWSFNIPLARRWVHDPLRSDAEEPIDLLLPIGQSFIIPHHILSGVLNVEENTLYTPTNGSLLNPARIHVWDLLRGVEVKSLRLDLLSLLGPGPRIIDTISMSEDKLVALMGREVTPERVSGQICIWDYSTRSTVEAPQEIPVENGDSELDIEDFELLQIDYE
eukprot:TRINITY_DN10154_c0_g1_i1.p1 TRINITY_DN10154_c0_g1~~TRINITY_DN10154_c0_g1_i1.p1  ORF type:complete len:566 (+),score=52.86 TRINITY_DN10154_c0_g1_i1:132-1829(+)